MSTNLLATDLRCDLDRLERTNMVTKMEDRLKVENSYRLYRSVPFVDSQRSREAVRRSLESRGGTFSSRRTLAGEIVWEGSRSIDSTFDALMEYVPKSLVTV